MALVRKQKTAAASLFDQRRLTSQKQRRDNIVPTAVLGGNATTGSSSVEMTNVNNGTSTKQISAANHGLRLEETKPLMSTMDTGDMDVV